MTPKEKAEELIHKFMVVDFDTNIKHEYINLKIHDAKECALVVVKEIIAEHMFDYSEYSNRRHIYWKEVKQEIEKL